ncbi:hypothetical protein [Spirosoma pomorum]
MLLTICTIRQLPQALTLGNSFSEYAPPSDGTSPTVLIGLVDDPRQLPTDFVSPYPILPVADILTKAELRTLSGLYTPTEFAAACKPRFIQEAFQRYPSVSTLLYADPNIRFYSSVDSVYSELADANILLTPYITRKQTDLLADGQPAWPDEKFFQNIGLYNSDFLALRRSTETSRFLDWWQDRTQQRAYINYCEGLCIDQIWLMHVPVFFKGVKVIKQLSWNLALWNLPERIIRQAGADWLVTGVGGTHTESICFANFKGLFNMDEGFFPNQNRLILSERPYVVALLNEYKRHVSSQEHTIQAPPVAYGRQVSPLVLRGWRKTTVESLRAVVDFIDRLPLPVFR